MSCMQSGQCFAQHVAGVLAGIQVADYKYGGQVVRVREGALGDGLGAKVWTVAHILCK